MTEQLTVTYGTLPDDAREVRIRVFVEEQGFEEEFDCLDHRAHHALLTIGEEAIGTGRVFIENGTTWHIGRLAVKKAYRGQGKGAKILAYLEKIAKQHGATEIILGAQCRAQEFYALQGYAPYGEVFYEDDCPHVMMKKGM